MYEKNYNELVNQCVGLTSFKHTININSPILPFVSRNPERVKFKRGFDGILGEFSRISCDKIWDDNLDIVKIVDDIISKKQIDINEEDKEYLKKIIQQYLINDDEEINILNPKLLLYLSLSNSKEKEGEKKIAKFIRDVFFKDISDFNEFFTNKTPKHIIVKLILDNISTLKNKKTETEYLSVLPFVCDVFKEDIDFIRVNEDFLMNNLEYIFAFYYFFYISQLSLKLQQGLNANLEEPTKVYTLLDWEKASKGRKSVNNGYNVIKKHSKNLLVEINRIEHLNILLGTRGLLPSQINQYLYNLSNEDKEDFLYYLDKWINKYSEIKNLNEFNNKKDFKTLNVCLFKCLNKGITKETKSRYALNLHEVAKKYFIKSRGAYGNMLNLNKDMLKIITALCVKDKKIKLTYLFKEYEKRGLYFDKDSQKEIESLLNKWNLIDKKSDSGDAQYVKTIL